MLFGRNDLQLGEVEEALLYLSKIGALKLEGGFLVLYNAMDIRRIKDNKSRYKVDDYRLLNAFYKQKIQQVHIVGEYANLMVKDYNAALQFVQDYFQMDYRRFIAKYFRGERINEIQRNLTPPEIRTALRGALPATDGDHLRQGDPLHRGCGRTRQRQDPCTGPQTGITAPARRCQATNSC